MPASSLLSLLLLPQLLFSCLLSFLSQLLVRSPILLAPKNPISFFFVCFYSSFFYYATFVSLLSLLSFLLSTLSSNSLSLPLFFPSPKMSKCHFSFFVSFSYSSSVTRLSYLSSFCLVLFLLCPMTLAPVFIRYSWSFLYIYSHPESFPICTVHVKLNKNKRKNTVLYGDIYHWYHLQ